MDKRDREANKRYREAKKENYMTISLTIEKDVMRKIEKAVSKTSEKNWSQYIEVAMTDARVEEMPKRRKFGTYPDKKTFTFSEDFVKKIKKSGNMSLFIEDFFAKKFKIK